MMIMRILFFFTKLGSGKMKKKIFSYYVFEQGYLNNCITYRYKILYSGSLYPFGGKRVSDFLFRP